jgi:hypothetical protein
LMKVYLYSGKCSAFSKCCNCTLQKETGSVTKRLNEILYAV